VSPPGRIVPCVSLAAALLAAPATPDDSWVRVRSPHFEVLSAAGEAPAREAARRLEHLRVALLQLFPADSGVGRLVTLIMFGETKRFGRFVPREHHRAREVAGFFRGGSDRDYAVFVYSTGRARPFATAEHEYAHLVLNQSLPAQPVWVAEGLAELLSDGVFADRKAFLGSDRPDHEALLRRGTRFPLATLLGVRYDSDAYLGEEGNADLYAASWALARWVIHRRGLTGLRAFLCALAAGDQATSAFSEHLGSQAEVEDSRLEVPAGPVFRLALESGPRAPASVSAATAAEIEHRLGDLLLHGGDLDAAQAHFERALEDDPTYVPARVGLGALLGRRGRWGAARRELDRALAIEPHDPAALLRQAHVRLAEARAQGTGLTPDVEEQVVADLELAVARNPQLYEAALLLARLRPEPYAERIALLQPVFDRQPDRVEIAQALASLELKRWDLPAARRVLKRAREAARTPAYRFLCNHLLARVDRLAAATVEVRGRLIQLDCRRDGSLRFVVAAKPEVLRLEATSSRSFLVGSDEQMEQRLICGSQETPLAVRYEPASGDDPEIDGTVLWLALQPPPE